VSTARSSPVVILVNFFRLPLGVAASVLKAPRCAPSGISSCRPAIQMYTSGRFKVKQAYLGETFGKIILSFEDSGASLTARTVY